MFERWVGGFGRKESLGLVLVPILGKRDGLANVTVFLPSDQQHETVKFEMLRHLPTTIRSTWEVDG